MLHKAMLILFCAILSTTVFAHGPSRQKVTESVSINAPAAKVWEVIGEFCSIEKWHPAIFKCTGEGGNEIGATRVLTIDEAGGAEIQEELQQYDAGAMTYKYRITKTDMAVLPVTTYSAFLSVKDNGDKTSTVEWRGGFYRGHPNNNPPANLSDEAATKAVTGVYQAGLANIKVLAEQ
jgi:Polyketide cyclase / dehydrase and lipid transport